MKTTVYVDRAILDEAMRLAGSKKMTEVINLALRDFVRRQRLARLTARIGTEDLALTLDELEELRKDE